MAQKFNPDNKLSPKELAEQLRLPVGETGKQIGVEMNKSNKHICLNSYKVLNPADGSHILEMGMGNGCFVKDLLAMGANLKYTGVDFSSIMVQEAKLINKELMESNAIKFKQASIEDLPFYDNRFDCIVTTNTIYFWPQPLKNTQELLRVLKPKGKLLVAYRSRKFMDELELTKHGFEKYECAEVEDLIMKAGFKNISTQIIKEPEVEFEGKLFQVAGVFTEGIKL